MSTLTVHRMASFTRGGAGGSLSFVAIEPQPLAPAQRHAMARALGGLTAFLPAVTPDPMPVAFFDDLGQRETGEQVLIAVFRALALQGRTIARRVLLDTVRGPVPVQEEVFRRPTQAQVWVEIAVPTLEPVTSATDALLSHLRLPQARVWRTGTLLLIDAVSLDAIRSANLDPGVLEALLPRGATELLLFSAEASNPFFDLYVRHVVAGGHGRELPASVTANAALAVLLWTLGKQQPFFSIEQGAEAGSPSRVSVWIEGAGDTIQRVSVGGQVAELERFEREVPSVSE